METIYVFQSWSTVSPRSLLTITQPTKIFFEIISSNSPNIFAHFYFRKREPSNSSQNVFLLIYFGELGVKMRLSIFYGSNSLRILIFEQSTYQSLWKSGKLFQRAQQMSRIMALWYIPVNDTGILESSIRCTDLFFIVVVWRQEAFCFLIGLLKSAIWSPWDLPIAGKSVFPVRTLCLSPAGASKTQVLCLLIPDIISKTTKGFDSIFTKGRKPRKFLNMCEFWGTTQPLFM